MNAIGEASPSSSSVGPSVASHEITEPRVPRPPSQSEDPLPDMSQEISMLREVVDDSSSAGNVELAIECLTDNAHSKNVNMVWFCLTKLWALARESDAKKRAIIFGAYTLDAIFEAMMLYSTNEALRKHRELSWEIVWTGCGLLYRPHISESGGIEAILNALLAYKKDLSLQTMGMGALKVLSFDSRAKEVM